MIAKMVYVVKNETGLTIGVFSSRKAAVCWANRLNDHPKYDSIATVYDVVVADCKCLNTEEADNCFKYLVNHSSL